MIYTHEGVEEFVENQVANVVSLPIQITGDCLFNNRYKRGPLKIALRAGG